MHGDEANQAVKTGDLLETGTYTYDPSQHHGPSLYYLTLPALWAGHVRTLADSTELSYRVVPVFFGAGLVLLLLLVGDGLGRAAAVCAGALTAISPAMVFYSRYYVQEMLLVFFTFAAIASVWRYTRTRSVGWILAAGAAFGLMHATKETWVLAAAAMAAGLALTALWTLLTDRAWLSIRPSPSAWRLALGVLAAWAARVWLSIRPSLSAWRLALGALAACIVAAVLFSSFGSNLGGPLDSILAYGNYLTRAGGEGIHDHPWDFYLSILIWDHPARGFNWSEGLIVGLAVVGLVAALAGRGVAGGHVGFVRFLGFYTLVLTVLYSAVPYKTPWCCLSFLHGMILLAGVGAVTLVSCMPRLWLKISVAAVLAVLAVQLGWQSYQLNFKFCADQRNPYVYAHTSADVLSLARRMDDLAAASLDGRNLLVKVIVPENYWPLPWYLRKFGRVGYWHEVPQAPEDPDASVIITMDDMAPELDKRLSEVPARPGLPQRSYNKQCMYGLRPEVFLRLYVDESLWKAFLARQAESPQAPPKGGASP